MIIVIFCEDCALFIGGVIVPAHHGGDNLLDTIEDCDVC